MLSDRIRIGRKIEQLLQPQGNIKIQTRMPPGQMVVKGCSCWLMTVVPRQDPNRRISRVGKLDNTSHLQTPAEEMKAREEEKFKFH